MYQCNTGLLIISIQNCTYSYILCNLNGAILFRTSNVWIGLYLPDDIESCTCGSAVSAQSCQACRDRFVWIEDETLDVLNLWRDITIGDPWIGERCVRVRNATQWAAQMCDREQKFICRSGIIQCML